MSNYLKKLESLTVEQLKKQRIYTSLSDNGKQEVGNTKKEIIDYCKTVLPINYVDEEDFVLGQLRYAQNEMLKLRIWEWPLVVKVNKIYANLTSDSCVNLFKKDDHGTNIILFFIEMCVLWKSYSEFGLSNFILVLWSSYFENWSKVTKDTICSALLFSIMHYLQHGIYLPVVIYGGIKFPCPHATGAVIVPHINKHANRVIWNTVLIDSSGASKNSPNCIADGNEFRNCCLEGFNDYVKKIERYEQNTDITHYTSSCIQNIQKTYGTCTNWLFGITISILKAIFTLGENLVDKDFIEKWCEALSSEIDQKRHDKLLARLADVVILFHKYMRVILIAPIEESKEKEIAEIINMLTNRLELVSYTQKEKQVVDEFHALIKGLVDKWNLFNWLKPSPPHSPSRSSSRSSSRSPPPLLPSPPQSPRSRSRSPSPLFIYPPPKPTVKKVENLMSELVDEMWEKMRRGGGAIRDKLSLHYASEIIQILNDNGLAEISILGWFAKNPKFDSDAQQRFKEQISFIKSMEQKQRNHSPSPRSPSLSPPRSPPRSPPSPVFSIPSPISSISPKKKKPSISKKKTKTHVSPKKKKPSIPKKKTKTTTHVSPKKNRKINPPRSPFRVYDDVKKEFDKVWQTKISSVELGWNDINKILQLIHNKGWSQESKKSILWLLNQNQINSAAKSKISSYYKKFYEDHEHSPPSRRIASPQKPSESSSPVY